MQNKKECFEPDQRATQNKEELTEDLPVRADFQNH